MIYVCCCPGSESDVRLQGKEPITSLKDLHNLLSDPHTLTIEMENAFIDKYFTNTGLSAFVKEAAKFNPRLKFEYDDKYNHIYNTSIKELGALDTLEDVLRFFTLRRDKAIQLLKHVCSKYNKMLGDEMAASNKLSNMQLELQKAKEQIATLKGENERKQNLLNDVQQKLDIIEARIKYSDTKYIDLAAMSGIHIENPRYKKILYIKEITRVHYIDTFLYYLQEVIKTLYNVPARFVVMEPYYAFDRYKFYPQCVPHTSLTKMDVYQEDIYMAGWQEKIIEAILVNPSNVPYLIILDRTGLKEPMLAGKDVEHLYTVATLGDAKDIPMDRLISYSPDTLYIPHIEGFEDLRMEEKIKKYSSMEILQTCLQLIERR